MVVAPTMRCYIPAFEFRFNRDIFISMGNFIFNSEGVPESGETAETFSSPDDTTRDTLENSLRQLRLRRMQQEVSLWTAEETAEESPASDKDPAIVESMNEDAGNEDASDVETGADRDDEAEAAVDFDSSAALDELSQEVRRMRREKVSPSRPNVCARSCGQPACARSKPKAARSTRLSIAPFQSPIAPMSRRA